MIQIMNCVVRLIARIFDRDPNAIISPNGKAPSRVTEKSFNVCTKPTFSAPITTGS